MTFSDPLTPRLDTLDCSLRRARSASRSKPSPRAVPARGKSAEAVDESETGSANFFLDQRDAFVREAAPAEGVWGNREVPPATCDHLRRVRPLHTNQLRCKKG